MLVQTQTAAQANTNTATGAEAQDSIDEVPHWLVGMKYLQMYSSFPHILVY